MSNFFLGEVRMFGCNFAPRGWALCNGQLLSIAQNTALFSLLGTTYGGDGVTTFGLPNLQGRLPMGQGQGPSLTNRTIGEEAGAEGVTLLQTQLPSHTHTPSALTSAATQTSPANGLWATGQPQYSSGTPNTPMGATAGGLSGGNQPHENMPPFLCVDFAIALEGIYPSRN